MIVITPPAPPAESPEVVALAAALARFAPTSACPRYLRVPALAWLAQRRARGLT